MEMTRIIFEFTTKYGVYRDALYLPVNHTHTTEEIDAMKQQRLDNWFAAVEAPRPIEEIVKPSDNG